MKDGKVVILIIDDSYPHYEWKFDIAGFGDVKIVATIYLDEGKKIFRNKKDEIDIIVIDHSVIGGTTVEFIGEIKRSGFNGTLVGVSFTDADKLKEAGCDYCVDRNDLFPDDCSGFIGHLAEEIDQIRKQED